MRILGLDIGTKTIGVAISDPLGWTAQGITTIRRKNYTNDMEAIKKICNEYSVETIVAGMPKNMNGTIGPSGEMVIEFCERLKEVVNIDIEFWDERLTTVEAHKTMNFLEVKKTKKRGIVDTISAVYILETYLNRYKNAIK